ncbi:hypothetical protein IE81DRAFT_111875 [Ceraceosorus guamensis]|uniref:RlpA-like protein double-psi beta-barrel domain-containing protein n=1 Tax=Ceraceosorus guamensis TaxID=1522189 RepID=A0A316VZ24_9BASI|nr:hypothetical protein IE81DRAFT_111875 [Ceraceosorus guamensis]PWN42896.1 hypothetical protein IE81DRAFT_111875 [Ceraceosorus guamensis]
MKVYAQILLFALLATSLCALPTPAPDGTTESSLLAQRAPYKIKPGDTISYNKKGKPIIHHTNFRHLAPLKICTEACPGDIIPLKKRGPHCKSQRDASDFMRFVHDGRVPRQQKVHVDLAPHQVPFPCPQSTTSLTADCSLLRRSTKGSFHQSEHNVSTRLVELGSILALPRLVNAVIVLMLSGGASPAYLQGNR